MLLNPTDVAVDDEFENVSITIYSSTETSGTTNRDTNTLLEKLQNLQWNRGVSVA